MGDVVDHGSSGPAESPCGIQIGVVGHHEALGVQPKEHTTLPRGPDLLSWRIVLACGLVEALDDFP
jgi:hypothetical protein